MALLPYLLNYETSPYIRDIFDDGILNIIERRPRSFMKPWRRLSSLRDELRDVESTIKTDKDKFQVNLDVQHFSPEEISVKTADGFVIVEGNHEEKQDEHGYVSRRFTRRYALPKECEPENVESRLSSDGVLTVTAPKLSSLKGERAVPITQTGPVRRKQVEDDKEIQQEEKEVKAPEKKRRR